MKIVGGKDARPNSWPAMAFLKINVNGGYYMCGGTLIDRKTVLTAAHCLTKDSTVSVYLGLHDIKDIEEGSGFTKRESSEIIIVILKKFLSSFKIKYLIFYIQSYKA